MHCRLYPVLLREHMAHEWWQSILVSGVKMMHRDLLERKLSPLVNLALIKCETNVNQNQYNFTLVEEVVCCSLISDQTPRTIRYMHHLGQQSILL